MLLSEALPVAPADKGVHHIPIHLATEPVVQCMGVDRVGTDMWVAKCSFGMNLTRLPSPCTTSSAEMENCLCTLA